MDPIVTNHAGHSRKYIRARILTFIENIFCGNKEYKKYIFDLMATYMNLLNKEKKKINKEKK